MSTMTDDDLKELWTKTLSGQKIKNSRLFLSNPKYAYLYAKYIRKKRWAEKDELVFHKDLKCAYLYCVFIAKDIPDHLHNYFIAKKLDNNSEIEDRWISEYFDWLEKKNNCRKKN